MACFCGGIGFTVPKEDVELEGWDALLKLLMPGYKISFAFYDSRSSVYHCVAVPEYANVSPRSDKA